MPSFIKYLNLKAKMYYLEVIIRKIKNSQDKWRIKVELAKTISKFAWVYDDTIVYNQILPISLEFCFDDVNSLIS